MTISEGAPEYCVAAVIVDAIDKPVGYLELAMDTAVWY